MGWDSVETAGPRLQPRCRRWRQGRTSGNLYVADYWNYRIRRVDAGTGIITTIAGNGGTPGANYDGTTGPATQIAIGVPTGVAISSSGDAYWTTSGRVLRVDSN